MTTLHNGHRKRLRGRFLNNGLDSFEDHEVLELILQYPIARKDTKPLAYDLINRFNSLPAVFDAPPEKLLDCKGMGAASVKFFQAVNTVLEYLNYPKGTDKNNTYSLFSAYLDITASSEKNDLVIIALNSVNKIIDSKKIFNGNLENIMSSMDEVIDFLSLKVASSAVIFHNRTYESDIRFYDSDIKTITNVRKLLATMKIELFDFIISSETEFLSIKNGNLFDLIRR